MIDAENRNDLESLMLQLDVVKGGKVSIFQFFGGKMQQ